MMNIRGWIYTLWIVFFLGWWAWGLTAKRAKRRQSINSYVSQSVLLIPGFWLLLWPVFPVEILRWRILPVSVATPYVAMAFALAGFGLAIWARRHLGGNWSATVTVKRDHELVRAGPYAVVRHPIYSGISLSALGLALLNNGDVRSIIAICLVVLGWRRKFQLEEQFMQEEFGGEYLEYKRHVKALIPFVW
jgi:protein-S-isoprenylcysteine O-methyltransferase Ste14